MHAQLCSSESTVLRSVALGQSWAVRSSTAGWFPDRYAPKTASARTLSAAKPGSPCEHARGQCGHDKLRDTHGDHHCWQRMSALVCGGLRELQRD